jgi:protease-4
MGACRVAAFGVLAALLAGCCQHPLRMCAQGDMKTATVMDNTASRLFQEALPSTSGECSGFKIALIDVDGVLLNRNMSGPGSFGENPVALFREKLEAASRDSCIRAVVLRINSPGGGVTACDIMRHDLLMFKQRTGLPVVACLMDVGTGGAYYLATAADMIYANPTTVTGGIGVVFNMYSIYEAMQGKGTYDASIKAGQHIDMGSPIYQIGGDDYPRPAGQIELLRAMAREFHLRFQDAVTRARPLHDPGREEDFDGRIFSASEARAHHLIDEVGYLDDAIERARALIGGEAAARVVMFRRLNDRALSQYEITPNVPTTTSLFPLSIPGLDRSRLPMFLYLWQPEPTLEKIGAQ